jgi:hypothetical protein
LARGRPRPTGPGPPGGASGPAQGLFTLGTVFPQESGDLFGRVVAGISRLLSDPSYRTNVRPLGDEAASLPDVGHAASLLEQLAWSRSTRDQRLALSVGFHDRTAHCLLASGCLRTGMFRGQTCTRGQTRLDARSSSTARSTAELARRPQGSRSACYAWQQNCRFCKENQCKTTGISPAFGRSADT